MSESTNDTGPAPDTRGEWAVVELMGHRRTAGRISEVQRAGAGLLRIETPVGDGTTFVVQEYSGAAIFGITPCDEAFARAFADENEWGAGEIVRALIARIPDPQFALTFEGGDPPEPEGPAPVAPIATVGEDDPDGPLHCF